MELKSQRRRAAISLKFVVISGVIFNGPRSIIYGSSGGGPAPQYVTQGIKGPEGGQYSAGKALPILLPVFDGITELI
jgi:hypothetical protein